VRGRGPSRAAPGRAPLSGRCPGLPGPGGVAKSPPEAANVAVLAHGWRHSSCPQQEFELYVLAWGAVWRAC
jgi:hypothetical protein